MKFKPFGKKKEQKEAKRNAILGEIKDYDIDQLNARYDGLINRFIKQKLVTKQTREIGDELNVIQDEVNTRLQQMQREVRRLDQEYNRSIVNKTDFDLDHYKKVKEVTFKLDSLSRTLRERTSAIDDSFMIKR